MGHKQRKTSAEAKVKGITPDFPPPQMSFQAPRWALLVYSLVFATILGYLSHWKVYEFDLFFDSRIGGEILKTGHVQQIATWGHTYFGKTCYNFEWLSTVAQYLAAQALPNYVFSGWLRSLLTAIWGLFLIRLIRSSTRSDAAYFLVIPLLLAWSYGISYFRLQMRPDLFATCHYVMLLALWNSEWTPEKKRRWSLPLLLSWANFHTGTVPIGIFVYSVLVVFLRDAAEKWINLGKWLLAGGLILFLTPQGYHVLSPIFDVVTFDDSNLQRNPDMQPLTWKLFETHQGGWVFRLWLAYNLAVLASYFYLWLADFRAMPRIFQKKWIFWIPWTVMVLMTCHRIRMIHYQVAFFLPLLAAALAALLNQRKTFYLTFSGITLGTLFLCAYVLPYQVQFIAKPIGNGVLESDTPVHSVAFIKQLKPEKNLLNAFDFGGYLIAELPEYPVALDGWSPVRDFLKEKSDASATPETYAAFLKKYQINTVLEEIPRGGYNPQSGFIDTHDFFFPRTEWALVYFDAISVVYLRRIPAHAAAISQYEYHAIKRGTPANMGASWNKISEPLRALYEHEFDSCLTQSLTNTYCFIGKSAFLRRRGDTQGALKLLQKAEAVDPRNPELLVEFTSLLNDLGRIDEGAEYDRRFKQLTSSARLE